jgi:mRNA interferase RelE/StbE
VYEVYLERAGEQDLKRLSAEKFHRILPQIKALSENPRPFGCHKISGSKSDWRIRVGDYRVLYEIDDKVKIVKVFRIRHRREVYR